MHTTSTGELDDAVANNDLELGWPCDPELRAQRLGHHEPPN